MLAFCDFCVARKIPICLACFGFHIDLYEVRLRVCAWRECNKCNNAISTRTLAQPFTQPHVFKCCPKHVFVASCGILASLYVVHFRGRVCVCTGIKGF